MIPPPENVQLALTMMNQLQKMINVDLALLDADVKNKTHENENLKQMCKTKDDHLIGLLKVEADQQLKISLLQNEIAALKRSVEKVQNDSSQSEADAKTGAVQNKTVMYNEME